MPKTMTTTKTTMLAITAALLFTLACGNGDSNGNLSGPSNTIPNVAGTYRGTTTINFPELNQTVSCTSSTSVTQATGGRLSIAPLQLTGACGTISLPLGDATIDATGSLGSDTGSYFDSSCGGTYTWTASGGFFGRDLRASFVYTSRVCWNMNITINLTR